MHAKTSPSPAFYPAAPRLSATTIALVAAAHAAGIALLASLTVVPLSTPTPLTTLMVHIVTAAPAVAVAPPKTTPAATPTRVDNKPVTRAKPVAAPLAHQPLLAAQSDAPGVGAEAAPAREAAAPAAAAATASASASAATSVSAPRFDAGYLANPAPSYPSLSRKMGEEGRVVLRVLVDASGHTARIEIKTSSAWPRLDQAAQDAVARWKFVPARRGDEAVDAWVLVPIVFNLRS